MKLLLKLLICLLSLPTLAQTNYYKNVESKDTSKNIRLLIGSELSSLEGPEGNLFGYGIRAGILNGLNDQYAVSASLGQTYGSGAAGLSSLYTSITASVHYVLEGSFMQKSQEVYVDDKRMLIHKIAKHSTWDISGSIEQMFLNGASSVYPATGLSAGTSKDFKVYGHWLNFSGRFSLLTAQSQSVYGIFFNILYDWPN